MSKFNDEALKESIAQKVHAVVSNDLRDVPFDKGLPQLRKVLWDIADEHGVEGADIFRVYMDWLSDKNSK